MMTPVVYVQYIVTKEFLTSRVTLTELVRFVCASVSASASVSPPLLFRLKVETHLTSKGLMLHRAFSVFLFDKKGRILMQRRADSKHTFAGFWTNTCCRFALNSVQYVQQQQ